MLLAVEDSTILAAITMVLSFLSTVLVAVMQFKMAKLSAEQARMAKAQDQIVVDVKEVKHATNSMHEEIVSVTKESATRQGAEDERARATAEEATLARGALAERDKKAAKPTSTVADNVEEVKGDVKIVKRDVRDVHETVVEQVKTGVQRGIEEAKEGQ